MASMAYIGVFELMFLFGLGGGGLFGVMGLPPGERDPALVRCPSGDVVIYAEWAERSGGKPGGPGFVGLAADPEVRQFLKQAEQAILKSIEAETSGAGAPEETLGRHVPPLVKLLLNRPGCLYVEFDAEAKRPEPPAEGPALDPITAMVLAGLKLTFIVSGGEQADEIAKHVEALVALLPPREQAQGLQRQPLPVPVPGTKLVLHRHEGWFIVGFGEGTVERAVEGLNGNDGGLAASERFQSAMQKTRVEPAAMVSFIDIKGLTDKAVKVLGPAGQMVRGMIGLLGLDAIEWLGATTGIEDGRIVTRSFVQTGGSTKGILALAAGRAIRPDDFSHVPADADLAVAFTLSAARVLSTARELVSTADPWSGDRFEGLLDQLQTELGFSFEDELFPAFGDVWTLYDSPSSGGLIGTAAVLGLEVRDLEKATAIHKKLMGILERALPGDYSSEYRRRGVYLNKGEFLEHTIHYVNTIGDAVPVAPAFCLTKRHLLVALHPQQIKAHLRFQQDASGGDQPPAGEKDRSFAPRLGKEVQLPQGELLCFSYVDSRRLLETVYALTPFFGQLVYGEIQREGGEIDILSLPSGRALLPYVSPSVSAVVRTKDGLLSESRNGLPLPGGAGMLLNLPAMMFFMFASRSAVMEMQLQAVPALMNALPEIELRHRTIAQLESQFRVARPEALRRAWRAGPPVRSRSCERSREALLPS